ncbi:tryptophan halogenase family protein [Sphingomonas sp. ASV193]|uniref:tryptophan halogenase family protein n=1 Tax=Sphingomonas sp. ASV193 TaxID=3144405 RepID=UPI0032E871FA
MSEYPIRRIIIVGGGTAGWMSAAALARFVGRGRRIVLVESDAIGTVGVGEGTIPPILEYNRSLGIDEPAFLAATKASYKLGIEFDGWVRPGERYFHQFGQIGYPLEGLPLYQHWLKHERDPGVGPLEAYSMSAAAAARDRFSHPAPDPGSPLAAIAYAFHFDAALYAAFLRDYASPLGVERIEGRIVEVARDGESGDVTAVTLDDGRALRGDLFVDCSGFRSLLLGEALGVPFEDWSRWLPCDRAVAVPSARTEPLQPYTRSSARPAGWQWRIPLQHRTGNGHVYSSAHIADDEAERRLLDSLGGVPVGPVNKLRFTAGRRSVAWSHNVVAIGLSAGFLEPLEATSIHLIQTSIQRLISLFPANGINAPERDEYNRQLVSSYDPVRDFLILHYRANRRDEPFWRAVRETPPPDSLAERLALFDECGRIFRRGDELFDVPSWAAVMVGQGLRPRAIDPVADALPDGAVIDAMRQLRSHFAAAADSLPLAADLIDAIVRSSKTR